MLTTKQTAELLNISVRTLLRHIKTGTVPKPIIVGGSKRWPKATIEEWIKSQGN